MRPRCIHARNPSPMTLDGTRTWIVGERTALVIDPGPDDPAHLVRIGAAVADAESVVILLTHRHPDHAAGADRLSRMLHAPVRGSRGPGALSEGDVVPSDAGALHVLATPGHTPDHLAFHWPAGDAIFCGDLMMGGLDTVLVAAGEGDLEAYLDSLARLATLSPRVIYPAHGPEFTDPEADIGRYLDHRRARLERVLEAVRAGVKSLPEIAAHVYGGEVDPALQEWIESTTAAYLEYLERQGRIEGTWR